MIFRSSWASIVRYRAVRATEHETPSRPPRQASQFSSRVQTEMAARYERAMQLSLGFDDYDYELLWSEVKTKTSGKCASRVSLLSQLVGADADCRCRCRFCTCTLIRGGCSRLGLAGKKLDSPCHCHARLPQQGNALPPATPSFPVRCFALLTRSKTPFDLNNICMVIQGLLAPVNVASIPVSS